MIKTIFFCPKSILRNRPVNSLLHLMVIMAAPTKYTLKYSGSKKKESFSHHYKNNQSSHFFFNQDLSSDKNDSNYFHFFEECCRGGNFPYFLGCKHRFCRCVTTDVSRVPTRFLRINNRKKCHLSLYMYFNNLICLQFAYSCIKITHNYPNSNHLIHMNKIIKMLSQLLPAIFYAG